jgi:2-oxoisovalerate ferredoxin oxidoreductase beta subunit
MAKLTIPSRELVDAGHSACPGCGPALAMRYLLKALGPSTIVAVPACCWTVIATPFPTTALAVPMVDNPIEATGASISGLRAAVDALGRPEVTIVGFAGDGGTVDIGLQSLSGMLERRTNAIYVMYDNEGYMNTGVQRSGATPAGAWTTTTPVGPGSRGKLESKKDLMAIVAAHEPSYAATLNVAFPEDFVRKVEKAKSLQGPRFLHVLAPCPPGWRFSSEQTIALGRLATDTNLFPLYEIDQGRYHLTRKLGTPHLLREYLAAQGRFAHLTPDEVASLQADVDRRYRRLLKLEAIAA